MKSMLLGGLGLLAIAAAACTQEQPAAPAATAPAATTEEQVAQPASAGPAPVVGQIDWDAARVDAAARPSDVVIPQAVGSDPLTVPMLLPEIVQTASDRPTPPRVTKDGYFATYHLPRYDVIVNGSSKAYQAGSPPAGDKTEMKFTTVEAGAQLAFSRYGADYVIEFECREVDSPEGCITEAQAKEFAESLFVAQSR
ncbi:MAG: hypothetical protein ACOYMK_05150 [Hyphomonadaceae bacterium]